MALDRIKLIMLLAIGGATSLSGAAFAEDRGTLEQQMACTPDVWRLCSNQIPDTNRIVGCLRQNVTQLSAPCRAVFDSNNTMSQGPRGRMAPPSDDDDE